ncbi:MAG: nuclear transport factor 2 family protein [Acidobacteriota bacterium]|nr:nuclear transport factor 2 family protein [Acidobacteriota bacterium]
MKKIITIIVMAIAASSAAFGQTNKDEQTVRQTLNELAAAINSQDMAKLDGFYAADYVLINPSGARINKTERLASIKNEKPTGAFGYENVKVRFYGDTAIVNTNVRTSAAQDSLANLTTLVLVRKGKGWQLVNAQGTPVSANQSGGDAEQAIRQTMTELFSALNRGDADAAGRIYTDDYQIVMENGVTVTKAQRLEAMRSGALKFQSVAFDNLRIRQYGSAAIATFRNTGRSNALGSEQENNSVGTVTLINNGGRWQVASAHLTKPSGN